MFIYLFIITEQEALSAGYISSGKIAITNIITMITCIQKLGLVNLLVPGILVTGFSGLQSKLFLCQSLYLHIVNEGICLYLNVKSKLIGCKVILSSLSGAIILIKALTVTLG